MPADLPEAWNEGMREMLGLETLGNDRDGCMQDLRWPCGMFGYFPTYTVGALMAAQLFAAINRACPDLEQHIRWGELAPLNGWLREHVWSQGFVESGMALVARATGQPVSTEAFEQHLKRRYLLREA
jgi:carboxypeptidase Taq